jgi:preprotein translocase subunit YajC
MEPTMIRLWPLLLIIPFVWFAWFMLRQQQAALHEMFENIRKTKRTYVLNDEGTAYVLKETNDGD